MRLLVSLLAIAWTYSVSGQVPLVAGGTAAGQPVTVPDGLTIQRQTLDLDLRPLARRGFQIGLLESTYLVRNELATPAFLPLILFSRTSDSSAVSVTVDGRAVEPIRQPAAQIPALWQTIKTTPAAGGGAVPYQIETGTSQAPAYSFGAIIPPGLHQLRITQRLRLGSYDAGTQPNRIWQAAYSLAPSRLWAGFTQFDVSVRVPDGWSHEISIPLREAATDDGPALVGRFAGPPGDILAVSLRAPDPFVRLPFRLAGLFGALLVCAFVGWIGGRLVRQRGTKTRWALALSFLGGALAAITLVVFMSIGDDAGDSSAFATASVYRAVMVVGPIAIVLGFALAHSVTVWVAGKSAPAPLATPERA